MVWCRMENMKLGFRKDGLLDGLCESSQSSQSSQRTGTHCRVERPNWSRWERMAGSSRGWRGWWKAKDSCLDNIQCPDCWCSEDCPAQGGCQ